MPAEIPKHLIQKLQKIRELSDPAKGGKPGEIENAAAMLSRLLLTHNLTLSDLDQYHSSGNVVDAVVSVDDVTYWKKELAYYLSRSNGCKVLAYDSPDPEDLRSSGYLVVVGRPENIAVVQGLYEWLVALLPKMAYDAWLEAKQQPPRSSLLSEDASFWQYLRSARESSEAEESWDLAHNDPSGWRRSYISGVIYGLGEKLERQKRQVIAAATKPQQALVPVMDKEVDEYIEDKFKSEATNLKQRVDAATYRRGIAKGMEIPLEAQVYAGGNAPSKAIEK